MRRPGRRNTRGSNTCGCRTIQSYDIAAVLNSANRIQVFVVGAHSGQIYTCELKEGSDGNWIDGPWAFIGGPRDTLQLAAAKNTDGLLEVFAVEANGRVLHNKQ